MREIKFRGKNKHTQNLVYGDLIHKCGKTYIGYWAKDDSPSGNGYIECEVIPETIGQYTGLKDKNGKEIYEKDIIMGEDCDGVYFAKVEWSKTDAQFMIEAGKYFTDELSIYVDDVVVVGNVFEKPEILKEIKI